jgi:maltooligosyltrehalose trehalohydrolase
VIPETRIGAIYLGEGRCSFCVWAPKVRSVNVHVVAPKEKFARLHEVEGGYHRGVVDGIETGSLYFYRLDDEKERPDPASRYQPEGVHGPSQVMSSAFRWEDAGWRGLPLQDYIIYELHVGTCTKEGTFDALIRRLDELKSLGITALELMPVGQFPGNRNWGYDGVYPFAVQNSYGGPEGLMRLVNACHQKRLAVILDVVYNHLGPEGNYLWDFGYYFTDRYKTPWGMAVNFDGPANDEVRRFFIENALFWIEDFHMDALRLDAVHAILDFSAVTFLEDLARAVARLASKLGRKVFLIAESALNDTRLIRVPELGGFGLDAQWSDDFHHALHTLLTGERSGYYEDFGSMDHLAKAFREGFVYSGQHSSFRGRRHGHSSRNIPAHRFVVFAQNHDQVGNRRMGDRLSRHLSLEGLKLAAGCVLLSPFIPLLFMGEEYGEKAPFPYFISHSDPKLVDAVRRGRKEEFSSFACDEEPPDPQDEMTFLSAKLDYKSREGEEHQVLLEFFRELIRFRKGNGALRQLSKGHLDVTGFEREQVLFLRRWKGLEEWAMVFYFGKEKLSLPVPLPQGRWRKKLSSADRKWLGPGCGIPEEISSGTAVCLELQPESFVVFEKREEQ